MDEAIDILPFPRLTWDSDSWSGEVRLPSWAGFQSRRGPYASVSDDGPSDGTARLTVDAETKAIPTPEQTAAFRHLIDNEAAVAEAVGRALLDYYPGERDAYLDAYDLEESDEVPEVADAASLRSLVGLSSVHVLSLARDGVACVGFEFGCVWDGEHGAGVMTHRGRVIATGQADCSFVEWMAKQGLDKQ
ncbi:MAG TPA: hypothetical protein VN688_23310 [Gemmataceae bacterium]|nr:hypothetical protein [Gemmataceae bacterium]